MKSTTSKQNNELSRVRDTVESVYIAIVLAFVLRAFMIEAFVIPTGSMANALYGEHYELECPCCHYQYAYGHSPQGERTTRAISSMGVVPSQACCPNCGYHYRAGGEETSAKPVFLRGGDRVLVLKYIYDFAPPKPWDVVVFKNPQNNRENYIKRLIGLPGEKIEIVRGDIFYQTEDDPTWKIRRKPLKAQQAMWQNVFTNDNPPNHKMLRELELTAPQWQLGDNSSSWDMDLFDGRVFAFNGATELAEIDFNPGSSGFLPYNGYNSPPQERGHMDREKDICTDWKLSAVVMPHQSSDFRLCMTFVSFSDRFRAEFNGDGKVRLLYQPRQANPDDENAWTVWGEKNVGPFSYKQGRDVALSVVDFRAMLWVDDKPVLQSTNEQYNNAYERAMNRATLLDRIAYNGNLQAGLRMQAGEDTAERLAEAEKESVDLKRELKWYKSPEVQMSASGQGFELWHIKLLRDVYYTSPPILADVDGISELKVPSRAYDYIRKMLLGNPAGIQGPNSWKQNDDGIFLAWGTTGNPIKLREFPDDHDLDEFFCLGDNSLMSHDGRTWQEAAPSLRLYDDKGNFQYQLGTVPRYNILGRAFVVYWPAGYRLPILNWPLVPNFGRMRLIK